MEIRDAKVLKAALLLQRNEITEYHVYSKLSGLCKDAHNAGVLRSVAEAEKVHALFWEERTGVKVKASVLKICMRVIMARVLGLTFTLKRMEKIEGTASKHYMALVDDFPEARAFSRQEADHEKALLAMLDEERLQYAGSIVLGLNDALVELTGALAGFTLALGETRVISLAGLITGISAAFSMAASDYLAGRAEGNSRAFKSALYTGGAYIITVALLILPFLLLSEKLHALFITLAVAVGIIFLFNYYLATAKDLDFKRRFAEMTLISLGIAALSFGVGFVLKNLLGV
ncbi:MAG: VIT1/CCC1 family protein [Spirochaetaceae bacterium]|jgi:VIT1/CCC1 family predicted Fe2+/Mn2+ transporter|nr:VIT1/CCC1 family protein [Spirochaetaceae bacterium]